VTPEIRAQAAVWVTDLHGPERDAVLEAGVRRWLAEDPRHAQAFELATEAWQSAADLLARPPLSKQSRFNQPNTMRSVGVRNRIARYSLAGATALTVVLAGSFFLLKTTTLSTEAAEQKTVDLADGTRVTLNANSRVLIEFDEHVRKVRLTQGEAYFNVSKQPARPFVVVLGNRKVIALGTAFEVRREEQSPDKYSVTLIEGRVAIEPLSGPDLIPAPPPQPAHLQSTVHAAILLNPGQRLSVAPNVPDVLDTPPIEKVTAWQRGQLIFEDNSLRDAAAEFNRYNKRKLIFDATVPDSHRVGGVFSLGDPDSFARAMANAYQLRIAETSAEIKLSAR
jgi:transmembrane sensor